MSAQPARPLFLDTSALYARFVSNAPRHDVATALYRDIRDGSRPFRPLLTSSYVCSELATLLLRKAGHGTANECLDAVRGSELIDVLHPGRETFARICESFGRYPDQQISLVDHSTAVLADEYDVDAVFSFDDDFRTFGLSVVPADLK